MFAFSIRGSLANVRARHLALAALILATACRSKERRAEPVSEGSGGPIDPISVRVGELLAQLRDPDPAERGDAIDQIRGLASRHALDTDEGIALLRALPSIAVATGDQLDPQTAVVAALAEDPRMPYLPVIEEIAGELGPQARTRAIALIGMIDDATAARYFLRLLRAFPDESPSLAFAHLQEQPQQADVLFPELVGLAEHPALFDDVIFTALAYCGAGEVGPGVLAEHSPDLLASYRAAREQLLPRQRSSGVAWMYAESYAATRYEAGLLLDLMGCLPYDLVQTDLAEALEYEDPELLYYTVNSLLTHQVPLRGKVIEKIAASDATRAWLFETLVKAQQPHLFPERWRTQEAFARSALAATVRRERGEVPDEIELLEVVPDGDADHYLMRFRFLPPHELAERGWMGGVAGPFRRADAPTTDDQLGSWTEFREPATITKARVVAP
jgi:hypothetical protein